MAGARVLHRAVVVRPRLRSADPPDDPGVWAMVSRDHGPSGVGRPERSACGRPEPQLLHAAVHREGDAGGGGGRGARQVCDGVGDLIGRHEQSVGLPSLERGALGRGIRCRVEEAADPWRRRGSGFRSKTATSNESTGHPDTLPAKGARQPTSHKPVGDRADPIGRSFARASRGSRGGYAMRARIRQAASAVKAIASKRSKVTTNGTATSQSPMKAVTP